MGDSIIGSRGNVIFKESLGSGYELFPDSFSFTLNAGDVPSEWLLPPPELRLPAALFDETPADAFAGLGMQIEQAPKLSMFKSDLDLLLDEMSGV